MKKVLALLLCAVFALSLASPAFAAGRAKTVSAIDSSAVLLIVMIVGCVIVLGLGISVLVIFLVRSSKNRSPYGRCPRCGAPYDDDGPFCNGCGARR